MQNRRQLKVGDLVATWSPTGRPNAPGIIWKIDEYDLDKGIKTCYIITTNGEKLSSWNFETMLIHENW